MQTIDMRDAQARLPELVDALPAQGEVVITRGNHPVARLSAAEGSISLRDLKPVSVGALLRKLPDPNDDRLSELLDR